MGIKPNEHVDGSYLSPNSLLLGRSSKKISSGPFQPDGELVEDPKQFKNRFLFIQVIVEQFWRTWMKLYFPTLVLRQKWHTNKRNVCIGDIVSIKDLRYYKVTGGLDKWSTSTQIPTDEFATLRS